MQTPESNQDFRTLSAGLGAEVRRLRTAAKLTQQTLADRAYYSRSYISLIEIGREHPSVEAIDRIARLLGDDGGLRSLHQEIVDRRGKKPDHLRSNLLDRRTAQHEGDPTNRREVTGGLVGLLAVLMSAPGEMLANAVLQIKEQRSAPVDRHLVASHQEWFDAMSSAYRTADPRVLLPVVSGYADSVLTILDRPMLPSERYDMSVVTIGAHTEAGLVAFNAGRWADAYRYLAVARTLAEEIHDRGLQAQALGASSYLFSSALRGGEGGEPTRAIALLERAADLAPKSDGLLRAWIAGWSADQRAALRDASGALADLEFADGVIGAAGSGRGFAHPGGCAYNVAGHLDGVRGQADALDGRMDEAENMISSTLEGSGSARQQVITLVRLAAVRVEADDPDSTCLALAKASRLADGVGYRMGTYRVRGLRARFPARWQQLPSVADLDEQLLLSI